MLPPPQPAYILRGHASHVHSAAFIRCNTRLVTGDADGWTVVWNLVTRRATAVWRAHHGAVLSLSDWASDRLITHGKDNRLVVWKFSEEDESGMSCALPVDGLSVHRRPPWLLHVLNVNTLNFCGFASCGARGSEVVGGGGEVKELLVAVPNAITSESVDILHLPSERRLDTVGGDASVKTGMVMAVAMFYDALALTLLVGYESGHTIVTSRVGERWHILYLSQPHSQPILSLDLLPDLSFYFTSSADAIIAKHAIPKADLPAIVEGASPLSPSTNTTSSPPLTTPFKTIQTKHSGQQSLRVRSDGKILATAGWDGRARVYSTRNLQEAAVLKWHKQGCFTVACASLTLSSIASTSLTSSSTAIASLTPSTGLVGQSQSQKMIKGDKPSADEIEGKEGKMITTPRGEVTGGMAGNVVRLRTNKVLATHWLVVGSKDGMISLWDVF